MAKILVMDDDSLVRNAAVQMLTRMGHEVVSAVDGKEGLARFQEQPFDLVLTDIVMPEREGLETIQAIRKINRTIPVIAISGGTSDMSPEILLKVAQHLGAQRLISKPFSLSHLKAVVDEMLPLGAD